MNTTWTGLLIGALLAIAVSSCIALLQLNSDAPWKELLEMWWKMLVLTIPAFASTTAAALLAWNYRRSSPLAVEDFRVAPPDLQPPPEQSLLSEIVVENARDQASWHYEWNNEPTRRSMQEQGVSQTIWNSGRHILTVAKIVDGNEWSPEPWIVIEAALDNIHAEPDRVWIRPLGGRSMVCLHIDEMTRNKRYTAHPTPPAELET